MVRRFIPNNSRRCVLDFPRTRFFLFRKSHLLFFRYAGFPSSLSFFGLPPYLSKFKFILRNGFRMSSGFDYGSDLEPRLNRLLNRKQNSAKYRGKCFLLTGTLCWCKGWFRSNICAVWCRISFVGSLFEVFPYSHYSWKGQLGVGGLHYYQSTTTYWIFHLA